MKSTLILASQYKAQASNAELGAINYILGHPDEIPRLSVKALSALSYSSQSTIVRLCRKLGFSGYRDMQQSLVYELAMREQHNPRLAEADVSMSLSKIMEVVTYRNMAALDDSLKIVDEKEVKKAVDLICAADSVLLFGLGASQLVAQDAYLKFIRIDKPCSCCEDIHSQYVLAHNAKPTDVAIVISYSGYTEEILRCAEYLKAQGTPIIAITRFKSSPIARLSACCLFVVAAEDLYRTGAMSSRISQLNMIDILYVACVYRNYPENSRRFLHNRIDKEENS